MTDRFIYIVIFVEVVILFTKLWLYRMAAYTKTCSFQKIVTSSSSQDINTNIDLASSKPTHWSCATQNSALEFCKQATKRSSLNFC